MSTFLPLLIEWQKTHPTATATCNYSRLVLRAAFDTRHRHRHPFSASPPPPNRQFNNRCAVHGWWWVIEPLTRGDSNTWLRPTICPQAVWGIGFQPFRSSQPLKFCKYFADNKISVILKLIGRNSFDSFERVLPYETADHRLGSPGVGGSVRTSIRATFR